LAAPLILYDYPQVAPESPGDLFDGTEIDEILTLRILTLTDAEKQAIRAADERGRELLDRTEALPPEYMQRLHGVLRPVPPVEQPHG
jgi:hydrogenase maturation protease